MLPNGAISSIFARMNLSRVSQNYGALARFSTTYAAGTMFERISIMVGIVLQRARLNMASSAPVSLRMTVSVSGYVLSR